DRKALARLVDQRVRPGADEDPVVIDVRIDLVADGIGRDAADLPLQPAIDRIVVRRDLDTGTLAWADEGDVARRHSRLDQQAFVERHDLHDLAIGRDDAADRRHLDILDHAAYWRAQGQALERVRPAAHDGGQRFDLLADLG